jgi:hypothetical protein
MHLRQEAFSQQVEIALEIDVSQVTAIYRHDGKIPVPLMSAL